MLNIGSHYTILCLQKEGVLGLVKGDWKPGKCNGISNSNSLQQRPVIRSQGGVLRLVHLPMELGVSSCHCMPAGIGSLKGKG